MLAMGPDKNLTERAKHPAGCPDKSQGEAGGTLPWRPDKYIAMQVGFSEGTCGVTVAVSVVVCIYGFAFLLLHWFESHSCFLFFRTHNHLLFMAMTV